MSSTHPTESFVQRRRTSPQAKWLANELAALRGELAQIKQKQSELAGREARLNHRIGCLELVLAPLPIPSGTSLPGVIRARTRFGARGSLNAALLACLEVAGLTGVSTVALREAIAHHFRLQVNDRTEREHLRSLIARRLRHLLDAGSVERLDPPGRTKSNETVHWRLPQRVSSLRDLTVQAAQAAAEAGQGAI